MNYAKQRLGQVLGGRYHLVHWVGGGGFADVYVAEDAKFDHERVAVKILKPEFAKRVAIEARIGRKFRHPNVVNITDMDVEGETPYIVMEYLEGSTVDKLLPLDTDLLCKFVREICDSLQHAHDQGLVHRDLKLQNIMLARTGPGRQLFKILDFGIAAQVNSNLTLRNATMDGGGTIDYMPPEYLAATPSAPSPSSDIYSFGILLFEILIGRRPFVSDGQTIMATLNQIETQPPPRFTEINPAHQIDSAVESLVRQCLSKVPERRPSTIQEVAKRFLDAYAPEETFYDTGIGQAAPTLTPEQIPPSRSALPPAPPTTPPLTPPPVTPPPRSPPRSPPQAPIPYEAAPGTLLPSARQTPSARPSPLARQAAPDTLQPGSAQTPEQGHDAVRPREPGSESLSPVRSPPAASSPVSLSPIPRPVAPDPGPSFERTLLPGQPGAPTGPDRQTPGVPLQSPVAFPNATLLPGGLQPPSPSWNNKSPSWNDQAAPSATAPPSHFEMAEPEVRGPNWVLRGVLSAGGLAVVVAAVFLLIQRHQALAQLHDLAASHQYGDAILDLEAGNFLSYPFIDRPAQKEQIRQQWLAEIDDQLQRGKLDQALEQSRQFDEISPADPELDQRLSGIADKVRHLISGYLDQDEFAEAVAATGPRSPGGRLARIRLALFDPATERQRILQSALDRMQQAAGQQKYAAVLRSGRKLEAEFPTDPQLKRLLKEVEVESLIQTGDKLRSADEFEQALAAYDKALELKPDPIPWRTLKLRQAETILQPLDQTAASHSVTPQSSPPTPPMTAPASPPAAVTMPVPDDVKQVGVQAALICQELLALNPADEDALRLRSRLALHRAQLYRQQDNLAAALCELHRALTDQPQNELARTLTTQLCAESGDLGLQHYARAGELATQQQTSPDSPSSPTDEDSAPPAPTETVRNVTDADREWQAAIDDLNVAIRSYEILQETAKTTGDLRALPLYYFRADARFHQSRPDLKGAVADLQKFRSLAENVNVPDAALELKSVQAAALLAWLQATSFDETIRNPTDAVQAATDAASRLKPITDNATQVDESLLRLQAYVWQAMAAAAAAAGDIDKAVEVTEEALANLDHQSEEWQFHNTLLKQCYLRGKPYVEPTRDVSPTRELDACLSEKSAAATTSTP